MPLNHCLYTRYLRYLQESISLFVDKLKDVREKSLDRSNPNNYISSFGNRENVYTMFGVYLICYKKKLERTKSFFILDETPGVITVIPGNPPKYSTRSFSDNKCIAQYSNVMTKEFYERIDGDPHNLVEYKPPFTKASKNDIPYQELNYSYIESVIKSCSSSFIPVLCDFIIKDISSLTNEKLLDIFSSTSDVYKFYVALIGYSDLSSSIDILGPLFYNTNANIVVFDKGTTRSKSMFISRFANDKCVTIDFIEYHEYILSVLNKNIMESVDSTENYKPKNEYKFYNSIDDVIFESNEEITKYKPLIDVVSSYGMSMLMKRFQESINNEKLNSMLSKFSSFMSVFKGE